MGENSCYGGLNFSLPSCLPQFLSKKAVCIFPKTNQEKNLFFINKHCKVMKIYLQKRVERTKT